MIMARVDCEFLSVILARSYLGLESVTLVPICFGYQCMTLAPLPDRSGQWVPGGVARASSSGRL